MPSLYCIPRQVVLSKNLFQFHSLYEWWAFICDLLGRFCWVWVAFGTALLHLVHLCAKGTRVQWSQGTGKLYEEHSSKYNSFMRNPALWRKGTALPRMTIAYRRKSAERRADGDWKQGEGRRDDDPAKHEAGRAHPLPGGLCCRRMHPQQVAGFATKGDRSCANVASFA